MTAEVLPSCPLPQVLRYCSQSRVLDVRRYAHDCGRDWWQWHITMDAHRSRDAVVSRRDTHGAMFLETSPPPLRDRPTRAAGNAGSLVRDAALLPRREVGPGASRAPYLVRPRTQPYVKMLHFFSRLRCAFVRSHKRRAAGL